MTGLDRTDIQRFAVSAAGALLISAACISAAITPAKAADVAPATAVAWKADVERKIDQAMITPASVGDRLVVSEVAIRFDDRGEYRSASLRKPSGDTAVDREALRIANSVRYPTLPVYLQGKPQTVSMQIIFGRSATEVAKRQQAADAYAVARANETDSNRAVAKIASQPAG